MTAQASHKASVVSLGEPAQITTADQLTVTLALRIMNWGVGPDRFLKGAGKWGSRWHFQPLRRLENEAATVMVAMARAIGIALPDELLEEGQE
jgi:hypothetical protein